jgi:glycosyltransferase involved in cell wall biosynthesis
MVASWHTNLHQYAWKRLAPWVPGFSDDTRAHMASGVERLALQLTLAFYRIPRAILAPNEDLRRLLTDRTGRPTFLMSRGVDTSLFDPAKRSRTDPAINVGYVGRLSPEKSVHVLATIARNLGARGRTDVRFTIVGEGRERSWLQQHIPQATCCGVLRGDALARAYANMDLFAFPSTTETVGNVVLEALASGVPVVARSHGALPSLAGDVAELATSDDEFVNTALALIEDTDRRQRLSKTGRSHALTLSWDRIFDGVYQVYRLATNSAPPADVPVTSASGPATGPGQAGRNRPAASVAARAGLS